MLSTRFLGSFFALVAAPQLAIAQPIPADNPSSAPPSPPSSEQNRGALRWGVGLEPSVRVVSSPVVHFSGDHFVLRDASFGLAVLVGRVGYQFPRMGKLAVGVYAEPRVSLHAKDIDGQLATAVGIAGSALVELDVGRYLFLAAGLSVGGEEIKVGRTSGRGPAMGGLTLRIGGRFALSAPSRRPRAITVAFNTMALFAPIRVIDEGGDVINEPKRTGSVVTIGIAIGYDAY